MTYSLSRMTHKGWIEVQEQGLPLELIRKRITIESLDPEGRVLASRELSESDTITIMAALFAKHGTALLVSEMYPNVFSKDELVTAIKLLEVHYGIIPCYDDVMALRSLFDKHGHHKVQLAYDMSLGFSLWGDGYFMVSPKSPYFRMKFTFEEALDFISERDGFYYAMDKEGNRRYDFIDKPTRKQVHYQKSKNGNQVVLLSFSDWKLYQYD